MHGYIYHILKVYICFVGFRKLLSIINNISVKRTTIFRYSSELCRPIDAVIEKCGKEERQLDIEDFSFVLGGLKKMVYKLNLIRLTHENRNFGNIYLSKMEHLLS